MHLESALAGFSRRDWQTTTDGTVRFALVGLGWWTVDEAIPAMAESDHCEARVLVSSSTERAERVASDVDTATRGLSYDEFHEGVATDAYDAVYVCTPNATHLDFARSAAAHGKDVLVEKPMEASVERAREMVAVCEAHDVRLAVGYRMQAEPIVRRVRELVLDGAIGAPRYVHSQNTQTLLEMLPDPDQWRLDPDLTGYGTSVMDLGVYSINTARFVLDDDPVAVQSAMHSESEGFEDVPDEHAAFLLEFPDGVYAACTTSQHAHATSFLEITGTAGHLRIEPAFHMESGVELTLDDATVALDLPPVNQMTEVFDYVAHALLTDAPLGLDGEHGVVDLEVIEAIHEAAETGVRLDLS